MADAKEKRFLIHISETRHFEFEVLANHKGQAHEKGRDLWINAATTGQWELPDTETDYRVIERD